MFPPVFIDFGMIKCKTTSVFEIIVNNTGFIRINIYITKAVKISYIVFYTVLFSIFNALVNIYKHFDNTSPAAHMDDKIIHDKKYSTSCSVPVFLGRIFHERMIILHGYLSVQLSLLWFLRNIFLGVGARYT